MIVEQGTSKHSDPKAAVAEATSGWTTNPEILFLFCSTKQDPAGVIQEMSIRFPDTPIAGCTTAGEHLSGQHHNGSLTVAGLSRTGIRWQTALIDDLTSFTETQATQLADQLFEGLKTTRETLDPDKYFCLLFIDGMSMKEEKVTSILADAIEGITLAGGSAGDDLQFKETFVFHDGAAFSNAATVVMGAKDTAVVDIIKHQHFITTPKTLVITEADPATRTVFEMDGYPAAEAYAAALGIPLAELTDEISFLNPVTFGCNDEIYVRSIQKINEDQSITFYCGIEEGMVLNVGGHKDITLSLDESMQNLKKPADNIDFILGFNCILRALEANEGDTHQKMGEVLSRSCQAMIGFDTYGEQLNGLHINQTLVAVAFRHVPEGSAA